MSEEQKKRARALFVGVFGFASALSAYVLVKQKNSKLIASAGALGVGGFLGFWAYNRWLTARELALVAQARSN